MSLTEGLFSEKFFHAYQKAVCLAIQLSITSSDILLFTLISLKSTPDSFTI
jgi:hypothetical protein